MEYVRLSSEKDRDIPYLLSVYKLPEITRFIGINEENFFHYVTATENVFYYKAYKNEQLAGTAHCELLDGILYLALMVMPEFQRQGIGTEIVRDIQGGRLALPFTQIEVSIDKANTASLRLFQKMGFTKIGEDEDLAEFTWSV